MEPEVARTLALCFVFAVLLGPPTARSSARREPIYGGLPSQIFNLAASVNMLAVVPGVLGSIVFGAGPITGIAFGVTFMILAFASLLAFSLVERGPRFSALRQIKDLEYTKEDARQSGL